MHPMDDNFAIPLLRDLFATALRAASPAELVPRALPPRPRGMVTVLGAGKASAAMAHAPRGMVTVLGAGKASAAMAHAAGDRARRLWRFLP